MPYPLRILLIDDSPYFLAAAVEFLNLQEGIAWTETASNTEEALTQAKRLQPHIVLLDINLEHSSGLNLIGPLRQNIPHTKIIVLTILDAEMYRPAALQAGADHFVPKTQMHEQLIPLLETIRLELKQYESG